ncbi:MAG: hypothetical protein K2N48_01315 [Muribaculaceae bacterium]|nr:hypothetical protein [Muribaculaceae bacterium]
MKKNNEIPIGGIGVIEGMRVMAKEFSFNNSCDECCFSLHADYHHPCPRKKCDAKTREDKKHVYFVKAEE